jgi:hypothetical protein
MAKAEHLMEAVREVLLREWDPIGIADYPELLPDAWFMAHPNTRRKVAP